MLHILPTLRYPLFLTWSQMHSLEFQRLCSSVEMRFLSGYDTLFTASQTANEAYYLVSGTLAYTQEPATSLVTEKCTDMILKGSWICEAAFWSFWVHVGSAEARTKCQLVVVTADALFKASGHGMIHRLTLDYGHQFCRRLRRKTRPWPSDVTVPSASYGEVFPIV